MCVSCWLGWAMWRWSASTTKPVSRCGCMSAVRLRDRTVGLVAGGCGLMVRSAGRVGGLPGVRAAGAVGVVTAPPALPEPGMPSTDRHLTESGYRTASAAAHGTGKSLSDTPSGPWHHQKRRYRVNWVAAGIRSIPQRAAGRLNADDPHRQVRSPCHAKETLPANPTRCYSTRSPRPKTRRAALHHNPLG